MHGGRSFEGISPEQTNPKFASPERPMSYKWAAVTVLWDALSMKRGRVMMTVKKMNGVRLEEEFVQQKLRSEGSCEGRLERENDVCGSDPLHCPSTGRKLLVRTTSILPLVFFFTFLLTR